MCILDLDFRLKIHDRRRPVSSSKGWPPFFGMTLSPSKFSAGQHLPRIRTSRVSRRAETGGGEGEVFQSHAIFFFMYYIYVYIHIATVYATSEGIQGVYRGLSAKNRDKEKATTKVSPFLFLLFSSLLLLSLSCTALGFGKKLFTKLRLSS